VAFQARRPNAQSRRIPRRNRAVFVLSRSREPSSS